MKVILLIWLIIPYLFSIRHINKFAKDIGALGRTRELKKIILWIAIYIVSLLSIGILFSFSGNNFAIYSILISFIGYIATYILVKIDNSMYDNIENTRETLNESDIKSKEKTYEKVKKIEDVLNIANLYIIPLLLYVICWICFFGL